MKKEKTDKTNAVRQIEKAGIEYKLHEYDISDGRIDGVSVAEKTGQPVEKVFKTLVTIAQSKEHYVCVVPVDKELDLKKAAKMLGEKKIEMIHQKELLPLTGYIHGGCSPVGMRKPFVTVIDETALLQETICVSGGKVGLQVELDPEDLAMLVSADFGDITK
ncbi:MAG: Cys-tRNA(Pro) deacylase [Eubacterium sp.]|nr:Cys-tRNA(Pro) deacylase [Eubacterium sp.]